MTVEYSILTAFVGALFLLIKKYLPDFPVDDQVFQVLIGYLLIKLGVTVTDKPAAWIRSFRAK